MAPGHLPTPNFVSLEWEQAQKHEGLFTGVRNDWVLVTHEYDLHQHQAAFKEQAGISSRSVPTQASGKTGLGDEKSDSCANAIALAKSKYGLPDRVAPSPEEIDAAQKTFDAAQKSFSPQQQQEVSAELPEQTEELPAELPNDENKQEELPVAEPGQPVNPPVQNRPQLPNERGWLDERVFSVINKLKKLG